MKRSRFFCFFLVSMVLLAWFVSLVQFVPTVKAASPATLNDPTEDGYIYRSGASYTERSTQTSMYIGGGGSASWLYRAYVEWDISSIPDGATITNCVFKYHGLTHEIDCHIHEMLGARPSVSTAQAIYDEAGEGTIYADVAGFPVVGTDKEIDLGATADSDLQGLLASNWFAIGIQSDNEGSYSVNCRIYSEEYTSTPDPTLYVEYTEGGDTTKPTYSSITTNSTVWATPCNFSILINDETALHPNGQYIFGCNNTGVPTNETAVNFTSTSQTVSVVKTLNSTNSNATQPEIVQFEWWFTDNAGNQNNTGLQNLTLCWQLSVGWNNVTIFSFDVGFTLAGINASLNYDSINWGYIVYQNSSTTAQYAFVKDKTVNPAIVVYQQTGILLIFCNAAGNWTHTYPYQGGGYGSDPTPLIIVASVTAVTVTAYVIYRKKKKKKKKTVK